MSIYVSLFIEPADRIECRGIGRPGRRAYDWILTIGDGLIFATSGQVAAIRDVIDRALATEEPAPSAGAVVGEAEALRDLLEI
jgi:hypothetical protein